MSDETQGQPPQEQPQQPQTPQPPPGSPPPNWQQPPGQAPNPDPYGLGPTSMGMSPTAAAAISYVFWWVTGLIFFLSEKTNKFVRFHAMQSIMMSIACTVLVILWYVIFLVAVAGAATSSAAAAGGGWLILVMTCLMWIVGLAFFVLWIICIIQAATGKWFKIPVIGDIAAKQAGI